MNWAQQCIVILPCFNEAPGLSTLLPQIKQHLSAVLVVDDGSTDDTSTVAQALGADVVTLATNQGKGATLRHGLHVAIQRGFSWALIMDGDGQHSHADIPAFLNLAQNRLPDLIIGNRMSKCANMPLIRRWTNQYLSYRISRLVGQSLPDTQCGFRLIRLSALKELNLNTSGFEIESEMLVQMAMAGHRIEFVPIATIYKEEQSKIHPIRDSLRWFRWLRSVKQPAPSTEAAEEFKPSQA